MSKYIVDASVAVEYLLKTPTGVEVAEIIESASLSAPELIDAEVLSVIRRAVLSGRLAEDRALIAIHDLADWPVDRISHRALVRSAWRYYRNASRNVSAYDAFYVTAAGLYRLPLLTADGRLSRASNPDIAVHLVRKI